MHHSVQAQEGLKHLLTSITAWLKQTRKEEPTTTFIRILVYIYVYVYMDTLTFTYVSMYACIE